MATTHTTQQSPPSPSDAADCMARISITKGSTNKRADASPLGSGSLGVGPSGAEKFKRPVSDEELFGTFTSADSESEDSASDADEAEKRENERLMRKVERQEARQPQLRDPRTTELIEHDKKVLQRRVSWRERPANAPAISGPGRDVSPSVLPDALRKGQLADKMRAWGRRSMQTRHHRGEVHIRDKHHRQELERQQERVLTELPKPINLDICREAYPIVLQCVRDYSKQLGEKNPITIQAITHLNTLAWVLNRECEYAMP